MESIVARIEAKHKKSQVVDVRSGDTVRVHQKIREGSKERVQIFEGLVIRTDRKNSLTASFTVRRIASGVGVEKSFMIHSPSILKVEVVKRSRVRRNYLSYMRELTGKSARLSGVDFDKEAVNKVRDEAAEEEEAKLKEETAKTAEKAAAKKEEAGAKLEGKAEAAQAKHQEPTADKIEEKPKEKADSESPAQDQNKAK